MSRSALALAVDSPIHAPVDQSSDHPAPSLERKRSRGSFLAWAYPIACITGMAVLLVLYLCQSAHLVKLQYKLVQLKEKQAALLREKTDLVLETQKLTSLAYVEQVATKRLGMILPAQRLVLDLSAAPRYRQAFLKDMVAAQPRHFMHY
ncbi:MAG: hypothetical protein ACYCW6_26095 [Candidatus Xenobia bacterium]